MDHRFLSAQPKFFYCLRTHDTQKNCEETVKKFFDFEAKEREEKENEQSAS